MKTIRLFIIAVMLIPAALYSQTVYVNSSTGNDATGNGSAGNPYKTFHKGYTMTASGGTLDLTGTFTWTDAAETGDASTSGYTIAKNITIQGQGADQTIVQAATSANTADRRIFTVSSSYTITFKNINMRYGYISSWGSGGAIYVGYITTNVTVDGCILENNAVSSSSYTYNYGGGALYYYNSHSSAGNLILKNSIIRNNTATNSWGGAIYAYRSNTGTGSVVIENSTLYANSAANGSALAGYYGAYIVTNSTITANNSSTCIILSNHGYGIFYMTNSTIAYNNLGGGYGLYLETVGNIGIKNSILAQNKRTDNSINDYYRSSGTLNSSTNNIIEVQGNSDFTNGVNGNIIGIQGCLGLSNSLDLNGSSGISPTLSLLPSSVAINAGTSTANGSISIPSTDQRGVARVGLTDLGAFEFVGTPASPELTVSTSLLSGFNYIQGAGPSSSQSFTVSGISLVNDITITASSNYEVSDGGAYSASVVLSQSAGIVEETTLFVRLKAGLSSGTRDGSITVSTSCDSHTIITTGTVSALPASTRIWTGASSTNWNTGSNWSGSTVPTSGWHAIIPASVTNFPIVNNTLASPAACNNLTINEGAQLTISANCGLTVSGNVVNNGNLYINSSASGEGSMIINGTNTGTGTDNVERYLTGSQWHLVSSPITNALAGVFEDIWLRAYNESTNSFGNYIQPPATPMPTGQGFSVWADANETRVYQGTINCGAQGPFTASLTGSAGPNTGWNLMGNPYTSAIDWDAASGWTKTNLANSVYIWNGTQYASYVGGVGANGGSRYIPKGQGFFVQATTSGASLSMNKSVQVHNSASFMKNEEDPDNTIRISVSSNGYSDEAVIVIRESNTYAFDPETDAYKFYGSAQAPQLVVMKDDNSELAIASFNAGTDLIDRSVMLYAAYDGQHTLNWSHDINHDIPLLFDNFTQTFIYPNTEYVFFANSSDLADRFIFKENPTGVDALSNSIKLWEYNNILYISNNSNNHIDDVIIYNSQGQIVLRSNLSNIDLSSLKPAVYIVKLIAGDNTLIEKIIVD